ncbi:MAG: NFACT family protein [bacterium]
MDSFFIKALGQELKSAITGARVGMPFLEDPFRIIFPLTVSGKKVYLYCSCHPSLPVLYLMEEEPPCKEEKGHDQAETLIQKYLTGADITEIRVVEMERILILRLQIDRRHRDLPPEYPAMYLIFELIGRYANVIVTAEQGAGLSAEPASLIDSAKNTRPSAAIVPSVTTEPLPTGKSPATMGKILVALRYVPAYKNRYRQILLGHPYRFPPPPKGKADPLSQTEETFFRFLEAYECTIPLPEFLHQHMAGLDLLVAREICQRARIRSDNRRDNGRDKIHEEKKSLWTAFQEVLDIYREGIFSPRILHFDNGSVRLFSFPLDKHPDRPGQEGKERSEEYIEEHSDSVFQSASEAARHFERIEQKHDAAQVLRDFLRQRIRLALERVRSRQSALEEDFMKADQAEEYRQKGDIITANLHQLKKGMDHLEAENFFDPRQSALITIPLDPLLTPAQNAQSYYRKYTKAKKSADIVLQRLEAAQEEAAFLSSLKDKIEAESRLPLLHEHESLLREKGFLHLEGSQASISQRTAGRRSDERSVFKDIRRYVSTDGMEILVGKNDRGNDALTCKIAQKDDLWLHTQDVAGSHVLIRNPERLSQIPFSTILQAASLAAYFSKARKDTKVAVDYAFRKYITKPKGARPGLVLMTRKSTVLVPPQSL